MFHPALRVSAVHEDGLAHSAWLIHGSQLSGSTTVRPLEHDIALKARGRRTPAERTAYLDGACGADTALRAAVEALLANEHGSQEAAAEVLPSNAPDPGHSPGDAVATVRIEGLQGEAAGAMIGRYKLLGQLGEGGFGSVWAAQQREPVRRRVALKIIKLGMDTRQVVARFEAERQALALMDHPNIAKVLDAGATDNGRPYFVMELVRGIPITQYCDRERMTPKDRLELFMKVCHAIQHAHQKGIIHRDIKPSNILVTSHDGIPVPKVIDFGIAKATQQALTEKTIYTQFSHFLGTPSYTSPEQAEMSPLGGGDIDTRADIYSLGVLLYELLTGNPPFDGHQLIQSGLEELRRVIREEEPPRPSTRLATLQGEERSAIALSRGADMPRLISLLRGDLDWIVMKCLEKDRTRRYDSAAALAADVQRHLDHEPVTAMPPSTAYRLRKSWQRNRLAYSAAAIVVMALIAGLGVVSWAFIRENQAQLEQSRLRVEAEAARATANAQRDLARNRLYQSLVREARSIRQARQVGYRREVFDRLQQALALQTPDLEGAVLRREAVACLGDWVGLDPLDIPVQPAPIADALVPDGSLLALATAQGVVRLFETGAGRELAALQTAGSPVGLAFDRRGSRLLMLLLTTQGTPAEQLESAALESWSRQDDGSWHRDWQRAAPGVFALAATFETPVAIRLDPAASALDLLDPATHMRLARVRTEAQFSESPRVALSQDRKLLAFFSQESATSFDAEVEVWNLETSQRIAVLKPQLGRGFGLSFGPEGRTLACSLDNTLLVYETDQFRSLYSLGGSFAETTGATLGGAATLAVPSFQEQTVHLIDLLSGGQVASLTSPASLQAVRFSDDGKILLVRHASGCRILHLDVDEEKIQLDGHQGGVAAVEFSPAGDQLASTGKDRALRLWDLDAPPACRVLGPLPAAGQSLAYHPEGRLLACADYATGLISLWSPVTGQSLGELGSEPPHPGAVWSCNISADGEHLAAVGGGLRVWRLDPTPPASGAASWPVEPLFSEARGEANVVFHPSGQQLAYLDILRAEERFVTGIYLRSLDPGSKPWLVTSNSQASIIQIHSFLPRSGSLVYVNRDREIVLVDPATGQTLRQFPTLGAGETPSTYLGNMRVSPDESKLAMVSPTGLGVELWDLSTGQSLYSLPDQPGSVWWLSWSPDSRRLAVSRANGAIAVWDTATVKARLAELGLE
jgi:serine/threonine protein kinase/WD40 repeat protein